MGEWEVVIVDDDAAKAEVVASSVAAMGYRPVVVVFPGGADRLTAEWRRPAVRAAIVDISLKDPVTGLEAAAVGFDLIRTLTAARSENLVVAIGSYVGPTDETTARDLRAAACYTRSGPWREDFQRRAAELVGGAARRPPRRGPLPDVPDFAPTPDEASGDYEWAGTDPAVRRAHGGRVVAVSGRQVVAAGDTMALAVAAVRKGPTASPPITYVEVPVPVATEDSAFAWCLNPDVRQKWGGMVVAVADHEVVAGGYSRAAAGAAVGGRPGVEFVLVPTSQDTD